MTASAPEGGVIVLAAGRARRFGSDKRAHRLPDGRSLLQASLELYARAFPRCIVVLRPDDPDPRAPAGAGPAPVVVRAEQADSGMGHSLAAGAAAARGWRYAFVALADMPWVRPDTLAQLRHLLERQLASRGGAVIVQPTFAGVPGHPVGFSADLFAALRALEGDEGARRVLRAHAGAVLREAVDDPGVLRDLDTPEQSAVD